MSGSILRGISRNRSREREVLVEVASIPNKSSTVELSLLVIVTDSVGSGCTNSMQESSIVVTLQL